MKSSELFDFVDYRKYLHHFISQQPQKGRGIKKKISQFLNSPTSHISQVLGGKTHFTLEQAEDLNDFLQHNDEESHYFLLLIQIGRAGTHKLKKRLEKERQEIIKKRTYLKERLGIRTSVSEQDQLQFYSSWIYGAIHILTTIPKFQTKESISNYIGVSIKQVSEVLNFLEKAQLVKRNSSGKYEIGMSRIHLGSESHLISKFHTNWRMKAIQSFEKQEANQQLYYSSVISIAESDIGIIKDLFINTITEAKAIIKASEAEGLHCFNLDFFRL